MCEFMVGCYGHPHVTWMKPSDVCKFLIWKDNKGHTPVHHLSCSAMNDRNPQCLCPRRLAAGTVASIVAQLKSVFEARGLGRAWCEVTDTGNPAYSKMVNSYVKAIREEQSRAHASPMEE